MDLTEKILNNSSVRVLWDCRYEIIVHFGALHEKVQTWLKSGLFRLWVVPDGKYWLPKLVLRDNGGDYANSDLLQLPQLAIQVDWVRDLEC